MGEPGVGGGARPGATVPVSARAVLLTPEALVPLPCAAGEPGALWITPGGRVEPGESAREAPARELAEELLAELPRQRPTDSTEGGVDSNLVRYGRSRETGGATARALGAILCAPCRSSRTRSAPRWRR